MDRCGLEWYRVEADVGMMGGFGAHEYMAPCAAGENDVVLAPGYAANLEVATAQAQPVALPPPLDAPEEVHTPGMTTVEAVARALEVPNGALLKAFPVIVDGDRMKARDRARRPPRQRDQARAGAAGRVPPGAPRRGRRSGSGRPGSSARSATDLPILLDEAVTSGGYVTGANKPDAHLRGVQPGRDFAFETADIRTVVAGDTSTAPPIRIEPAIEVGNIFKLGTRYSEPLGATYLDESGKRAADLDGLLRVRAGARGRRGGRAVRRRARDLVAAHDRPVRRRARRARPARAPRSTRWPSGSTVSSRRRACRRCTTTATPARARSSPTPSCSAARCG